MKYLFKTKKTMLYEKKMEEMHYKSFDYKFQHGWNYYNGYTGANFDRSNFLSDYRDNLHRVLLVLINLINYQNQNKKKF
mgnify:CR=1 FL=1